MSEQVMRSSFRAEARERPTRHALRGWWRSRRAALEAHPLRRVTALLEVDWRRFRRAVLLGALSLGSAVGLSAVAAWLIARASQMPPVLELSMAVVMVRAFGISRGVFRYLERLVSHDVALRGMTALRVNLYERLSTGRIEAVAGIGRGALLARVGADVDAVGDFVVRGMLPAGVAAVLSLTSVLLVGWVLPSAGLALLLCMLLAGLLAPWLSARSARELELHTAEARTAMTATSLELLEGAGVLTVAGRVRERLEALSLADRELCRATDAGAHTAGVSGAVGVWAQGLAVLAALALGIPAVGAGTLAPILLPVIVLVPLAAFEAFVPLAAAAVQFHRSGLAASRILALLDEAASPSGRREGGGEVIEETALKRHARVSKNPSPSERDGSAAGDAKPRDVIDAQGARLEARALRCGWPGRPVVLEEVTLSVRPGRVLAVVGPSGVGKSTLLMTLAGMVPPVGGRLGAAFGGAEEADAATLQQQGFFAAEDAHVFATSVFENLRVVRGDLTREAAEEALRWAGLSGWLETLPEGLDTVLGPDAASISGGERRRLLLARIRLSTRPLLFVDEPAEHLDAQSADARMVELMALARRDAEPGVPRRGLVIATHRLSALAGADEVLMLGHAANAPPGAPATIIARGTHAQLLASEPAYRWALEQECARAGAAG